MEPNPKLNLLVVKDPTYQVPAEKNLMKISTPHSVKVAGTVLRYDSSVFSLSPKLSLTISTTSGFHDGAISGYLMDANAKGVNESNSTDGGGPLVDGSVTTTKLADHAVTPDKLSETILKYLMPELTSDLQVDGNVSDGIDTLSVSVGRKVPELSMVQGRPTN